MYPAILKKRDGLKVFAFGSTCTKDLSSIVDETSELWHQFVGHLVFVSFGLSLHFSQVPNPKFQRREERTRIGPKDSSHILAGAGGVGGLRFFGHPWSGGGGVLHLQRVPWS